MPSQYASAWQDFEKGKTSLVPYSAPQQYVGVGRRYIDPMVKAANQKGLDDVYSKRAEFAAAKLRQQNTVQQNFAQGLYPKNDAPKVRRISTGNVPGPNQ